MDFGLLITTKKIFYLDRSKDGTLQNWTQQVYKDFERLFPCKLND